MKQVVQPIGGGPVQVLDVPRPTIGPTEVLVRTVASVISPGTERAVTALAQSSLVSKAKARPDLVKQVLAKARNEGLVSTARAVRSKLATDLPLGYSAAGIAVEVGHAVDGIRPGQLVATGGAGCANHAEWQAVPGLLCSPVPAGVAAEEAAFTTIASIALHGFRLAEVGPGSKVAVIGMGLIGQVASRLAAAAGCDVIGIDIAEGPLAVARAAGIEAYLDRGQETTEAILRWSRGRGADAVLLCSSGPSSAVAQRTPELCRDRARVVVVGDIGLDLSRRPFYDRELSLHFARSYGPGRYETSYEGYGVDYPAGHVRWTEGRNFEAVLDLLASKRFRVDDLVTHRFSIEGAADAYTMIEGRSELCLAVCLEYPAAEAAETNVRTAARHAASARPGVGWIGAGGFSTGTLLPAFAEAGFDHLVAVSSASGLSARRAADRHGFETAESTSQSVIENPDVEVVVIATPHESHGELTERALLAGRHVWCEKPLALTIPSLDKVIGALGSQVLFVGHNRRFSPAVQSVAAALGGAPSVISYRVNAGPVPTGHWYEDRRQGGRLVGEVCHFIDTCAAIAGAEITTVKAVATGVGELALADGFAVNLAFANGSVACIAYAAGGAPSTPKERIEVLGGGHTYVIDDFRSVSRDGKSVESGRQDKGHRAAVAEFARVVRTGDTRWTVPFLQTARATLDAVVDLGVDRG